MHLSRLAILLGIAACGADAAPEVPCADVLEGSWRGGFEFPGLSGGGAAVYALVRDPDGRMIAGGRFTDAAGVAVDNVAMWDGASWAALGDGVPAVVTKLAFATDGTLWAVGSAYPISYLDRWDGNEWTSVAVVAG